MALQDIGMIRNFEGVEITSYQWKGKFSPWQHAKSFDFPWLEEEWKDFDPTKIWYIRQVFRDSRDKMSVFRVITERVRATIPACFRHYGKFQEELNAEFYEFVITWTYNPPKEYLE